MTHLEEVNLSYLCHMKQSMYFAWISIKAAFYFIIHAFIPDIFTHSGSNSIKELARFFS